MICTGIAGGSGTVGKKLVEILTAKGYRSDRLFLAASKETARASLGQIHTLEMLLKIRPEFVFMAAGSDVSREWTPQFRKVGCTVIDKSSLYRMNEDIKLIVPEVNGDMLNGTETLVATPNCSTTQLVMVLAPLHRRYGIERVVVSTYQSVSGTGRKALKQLAQERAGKKVIDPAYSHNIDLNVIPVCGKYDMNGNTDEELKLVHETRKILGSQLALNATAVRVPTEVGHGESVNIEFQAPYDIEEVKVLLGGLPGVSALFDDPTPHTAEGRDEIFVGRIRRDNSRPNCLNLWIVGDNLRKGAALNAVQIMELLIKIRNQE